MHYFRAILQWLYLVKVAIVCISIGLCQVVFGIGIAFILVTDL